MISENYMLTTPVKLEAPALITLLLNSLFLR